MRNVGCITVDDGYGGLDARKKGPGGADTNCSVESILAILNIFPCCRLGLVQIFEYYAGFF